MITLQIYDKPMCCSSGVCGPQVDPVLPRFAADLEWLKAQGHTVERYNLAQNPTAFTGNPAVHRLLETEGIDCLPLIILNGELVSKSTYPSRETLQLWTTGNVYAAAAVKPSPCCGGSSCA